MKKFFLIILASLLGCYCAAGEYKLLTDPFLQLPAEDSVSVVWFTAEKGFSHKVKYGEKLERTASANSMEMSKLREDKNSKITKRTIWRHEARVKNIKTKTPYMVESELNKGDFVKSSVFHLSPLPGKDKALKILFTSDHQLKPMTAVNISKIKEELGDIDAVFFAGDMVNIPDRASEWFDRPEGNSFFPVLQGKASYKYNGSVWKGSEIIQNAPIFTAIGNHEVMGRDLEPELIKQFNDPVPGAFNTKTYEQMFTLPESPSGGERYYAVTFGTVRLVVLEIARIWRSPEQKPDLRGAYQERTEDLANPKKWGWGTFIYEPISKGSKQYKWLEKELKSKEFLNAKYRIVMFHHPIHSLSENIIPSYVEPLQKIEKNEKGELTKITYDYSYKPNVLVNELQPLLERSGVDLVLNGHCHLWSRFQSGNLKFLETSNVGNTYGANLKTGDPYGLLPVMPSLKPQLDVDGKAVPYIASNDISTFTVLETDTGKVSSYYILAKKPEQASVKFDEFSILR